MGHKFQQQKQQQHHEQQQQRWQQEEQDQSNEQISRQWCQHCGIGEKSPNLGDVLGEW